MKSRARSGTYGKKGSAEDPFQAHRHDDDRSTTAERVVEIIRAAGFVPVQRNTTYEALRVYGAATVQDAR